MIHFNLNIDLFYDLELKKDSEIKAIACIEYPVLHIIAKTLETIEEEYDELDKFIVKTAYQYNGYSIQQFSNLTGLGVGIFKYRATILIEQEYITLKEDIIYPIDKGVEFITNPFFEREIIKTRSFLLDGVSHQPLKSYFYKDGKENLISEDVLDTFGLKLFNPAIIHNPPSHSIQQIILDIPLEDRFHYNIPVGLKNVLEFDFKLMTYPIAIVLSKTSTGRTVKKLSDLNGFYANIDNTEYWQKSLKEEIDKVEIVIGEKEITKNQTSIKKQLFRTNWAKTSTSEPDRIFNLTKERLKLLIKTQYNFQSLEDHNIVITNTDIVLNVDKGLFESEGTDKKRLIESCVRGREYFRQNERTGVWLVFINVSVADDFVQKLLDLYRILQKDISLSGLLLHYGNDYKTLRANLIWIERFDKLEELDIYLFLSSREANYKQSYLELISE
jgi:hypothetical protein